MKLCTGLQSRQQSRVHIFTSEKKFLAIECHLWACRLVFESVRTHHLQVGTLTTLCLSQTLIFSITEAGKNWLYDTNELVPDGRGPRDSDATAPLTVESTQLKQVQLGM